ncbi:MAG: hypothetical protein B7Y08_10370 [Rhodospirillales bacterium 24-66-33]|nr:MAG: hypothetical protein B7Y08_10370 [Rhodospirillales bacterium 24-66-33]
MTITKDEVAAFMRHVYTAVGAGTVVAVAFGFMGQEDLGEGLGIVVGAIAALLPIINALRASRSASPTAQIRKVESLPDVTVVPITPKGDEMVEKAKK